MSWLSQRRVLMIVRLVLGAMLVRQGAIVLSGLPHQVEVLERYNAWQSWPLTGGLRPMQLALWIGASEFTAGIFLFGGLLTRLAAFVSALISLFGLAAFSALGLIPNLAHAGLVVASLLIAIKGGGAGTMDALLGAMQRRSLEREAEREAERRAAEAEAAPRMS